MGGGQLTKEQGHLVAPQTCVTMAAAANEIQNLRLQKKVSGLSYLKHFMTHQTTFNNSKGFDINNSPLPSIFTYILNLANVIIFFTIGKYSLHVNEYSLSILKEARG